MAIGATDREPHVEAREIVHQSDPARREVDFVLSRRWKLFDGPERNVHRVRLEHRAAGYVDGLLALDGRRSGSVDDVLRHLQHGRRGHKSRSAERRKRRVLIEEDRPAGHWTPTDLARRPKLIVKDDGGDLADVGRYEVRALG